MKNEQAILLAILTADDTDDADDDNDDDDDDFVKNLWLKGQLSEIYPELQLITMLGFLLI